MLEQWRERLRRRLIERLRPGRDEEELLEVLGRAEAIRSEDHRSMLQNLVMFRDVRVRELMVPRSEIFALDVSMSLEEAARAFARHNFSRAPAHAGSLDDVRGVIHAWDVFSAVIEGRDAPLAGMVRPCLKAPESQLVLGLLLRMKEQGAHLAVVVDEYGGTGGLVTITDLLTEIVGSLNEVEETSESGECAPAPDGGWVVAGRMHVEDFEEVLGRKLPEGDFDTVGGMVTSLCGRIPARGEVLEVAGLRVKVLAADPRRVTRLHITPLADAAS